MTTNNISKENSDLLIVLMPLQHRKKIFMTIIKNMTIKFYSICIFLCAAFSTNGQQIDLAEADSLFGQARYFEASVDYERVLFGNYDLNTEYKAITGKLNCLKKQQRFAESV